MLKTCHTDTVLPFIPVEPGKFAGGLAVNGGPGSLRIAADFEDNAGRIKKGVLMAAADGNRLAD